MIIYLYRKSNFSLNLDDPEECQTFLEILQKSTSKRELRFYWKQLKDLLKSPPNFQNFDNNDGGKNSEILREFIRIIKRKYFFTTIEKDRRAYEHASRLNKVINKTIKKGPTEFELIDYAKLRQRLDEKPSKSIKSLRLLGYERQAEKRLLKLLNVTEEPANPKMGWMQKSFPKNTAKKSGTSYNILTTNKQNPLQAFKGLQLDLTQYLIPKFRGIHYRTEASSRFSNFDNYESHVFEEQVGEPTLSASIYELGKEKSGFRLPKARQEDLESFVAKRIKERFKKTNLEDLIMPPYARDIVDEAIWKSRSRFPDEFYQHEQLYVNQYGKYEKELRSKNLPFKSIPQISTSDSPYHAALYAYGGKFSTAEELSQKDKTTTDGLAGGRRVTGVVGKVYIYFFTPEELVRLQPAVVPQLQASKKIRIKVLQQWEVESTFFGEIPGHCLVYELQAKITPNLQQEYTQYSNQQKGQDIRKKMATKLGQLAWETAQELAQKRRKILLPHGTLHHLIPDLDAQVKKENQKNLIRWTAKLKLSKEIKKLKEENNLVRTWIKPDGNCLFRAVAESIGLDQNYNHRVLRTRTISYMRANQHVFHHLEESYFTYMSQPASNAMDVRRWGGGSEIQAMADILNLPIIVHAPDTPTGIRFAPNQLNYQGRYYANSRDLIRTQGITEIHLLYLNGNHYETFI